MQESAAIGLGVAAFLGALVGRELLQRSRRPTTRQGSAPGTAEDPHAKLGLLVETSRQVIARKVPSAEAQDATRLLDQLEALLNQRKVGMTMTQLEDLVRQIIPVANQLIAQMEKVRNTTDLVGPMAG